MSMQPRLRALSVLLVLFMATSWLAAGTAHARLFFVPGDPALQGATVVSLSGFPLGTQSAQLTTAVSDLDIETTHPQGFYSAIFGTTPVFHARFPDGVTIDFTPPVSAVGIQYHGAECAGNLRFDGAAGSEAIAFQQGDPGVFVGAANIGDIHRLTLGAGCFAALYSDLRFVAGGAAPPTNEADLALVKTPDLRVASQADGSIVWTLDVDNAGPDDATEARTIDFLPFGVNVVSSNPPHAILAGTAIAQQGIGTLTAGANVSHELETDIPPFEVSPNAPATFSCNSEIRNVALTTATSLDPMGGDNLSVASVYFDQASRQGFPEICDNAQDDNCDGRPDCSDAACGSHPHCRPPVTFGPSQPNTCLFGPCIVPVPPAPTPPTTCTVYNIHDLPVEVPAHCCALNGPRVNGRSPAVCIPSDPNFKTADPPVSAAGFGYTSAGQLHTYTITYENVGDADALDVAVIDVLDPDLDDSTLVLLDAGRYDPVNRAIVWTDPVLPPADPRSVAFQVAVRSDAPPHTIVRNQATVIFPNATPSERADTNFVEHRIVEPDFLVVEPAVVGCEETAPGSGDWTVALFNRGNAEAWNASAEIIDAPASVSVSQGRVLFGAPDDLPGSPDRLLIPLNSTPSLGTVSFGTDTPGDPCRSLRWEVEWEPAPGAARLSRVVQTDPDADADAVADTGDNCPGDYNPAQVDSDADGVGDACEVAEPQAPVQDLAARAKSGKVDLTWTPPAGAVGYDVYRTADGEAEVQLAAGHASAYGVYADFTVTDGIVYRYEVVWRDATGAASPRSNPVTVTPRGRATEDPPPIPPACGLIGLEVLLALAIGRRRRSGRATSGRSRSPHQRRRAAREQAR